MNTNYYLIVIGAVILSGFVIWKLCRIERRKKISELHRILDQMNDDLGLSDPAPLVTRALHLIHRYGITPNVGGYVDQERLYSLGLRALNRHMSYLGNIYITSEKELLRDDLSEEQTKKLKQTIGETLSRVKNLQNRMSGYLLFSEMRKSGFKFILTEPECPSMLTS